MTINPAYGARHRHTGFGPDGIVKGLSALDLVVQAGILPDSAGPLEFANWLRAPVDAIIADLAILVDPIVDAAMAPYMVDINAAVAQTLVYRNEAGGFATDAAQSAVDAMGYRDAAQQIVDDFEAVAPTPLTVTELLAGSDTGKYATADALRKTMLQTSITFTATPAPDFTDTQYRRMTLTGNVTSVGAAVGCKVGMTYVLDLLEDGTGGRTLPNSGGWDACYDWGSEGFPTFATGANKLNSLFMFCYSASPLRLWVDLKKSA